jgi:hypothetical protein
MTHAPWKEEDPSETDEGTANSIGLSHFSLHGGDIFVLNGFNTS